MDSSSKYFSDKVHAWLLGGVCSYYMDLVREADPIFQHHEFRTGAAAMARDVAATGENWPDFAERYGAVGHEIGLTQEVIKHDLATAWRWAGAGFTHWHDLSRAFVYHPDRNCCCHVPTGEELGECEFWAIFQWLSPDPDWPILVPMIENGLLPIFPPFSEFTFNFEP